MKETDKITYVDFKSNSSQPERKPSLNISYHTNPVIDRLFKLVHTKLSKDSDNYKSYTEFKPDDLL